MINYLIIISIAVIGGLAITLQGQFMGIMNKGIGTLESVFITYAGGGLVILIITIFFRGGNVTAWRSVPWYALTTGIMGLIIVGAIGYTVPRMGLVPAFTILTASQFFFASLADNFGWFGAEVRPFEPIHALGIGFLLLGVWIILR
jgi:transporter family-2 protein